MDLKLKKSEKPRNRAFSRKNRVFVFRQFLLDTYGGYGLLSPGAVVLDVAGGKGDLSWILLNADDLVSIVVDPRVTKNHLLRSVEYLRSHPEEIQERAIPDRPTHQPLAALMTTLQHKDLFQPRHFRILVDADLVQAMRLVKAHPDTAEILWKAYWENALARGLEASTLGYAEDKCVVDHQVVDSMHALNLISQCRLVVGFHPDQATDYCIDLALALGVPFCVVPCCVFPSEFTHRRLEDGSIVRDYADLLQYLKDKSPGVKMANLRFHETITAKSIVLYTLPQK
jgi:hypothetical protein